LQEFNIQNESLEYIDKPIEIAEVFEFVFNEKISKVFVLNKSILNNLKDLISTTVVKDEIVNVNITRPMLILNFVPVQIGVFLPVILNSLDYVLQGLNENILM
jgi:hypothetical protein